MGKIPYFKYWCHSVLPLAYDNSLSYYELLCKVADNMNEINETVVVNTENINNIHNELEELKETLASEIEDEVERVLNDWAERGMFVSSVNGKNGAVELTANDVNAIENASGVVDTDLLSDGAVTIDKMGNFGAENNGKRLAVNSTGGISLVTGEGVASGVESVNGMDGVVVINTLPNPQPINFAGSTQKSYDGVDAVTINATDVGAIPMPADPVVDGTPVYGRNGNWVVVKVQDANVLSYGIGLDKLHSNRSNTGKIVCVSSYEQDEPTITARKLSLEDFDNVDTTHAGEFVRVDENGALALVAMNTWEGGSY